MKTPYTVAIALAFTLCCNGVSKPPDDAPVPSDDEGRPAGWECTTDAECREWREGPLRPEEAFCDPYCRDCYEDSDCRAGEYCAKNQRWCRPIPVNCVEGKICGEGEGTVLAQVCVSNECVGCGPNADVQPAAECPDGWFCFEEDAACARIDDADPECVDATCAGRCYTQRDGIRCVAN